MSPFAHGGDNKAGNATLFRRQDIMCQNGAVVSLPFYAGNAFRGSLRDILADDFIKSLGMVPRRDRPPVNLWFFHVLYAGGALEEASQATKSVIKKMGDNGAAKATGIYEFRDNLPNISLIGAAMGNRILSGRAMFADFRPQCKEYTTGDKPVDELFEWTFLTRHENHEDHEEHHGMIANTECLKAGIRMDGGIDMSEHISDLEKSALGRALEIVQGKGYLGAENRRGLGKVKIEYDNIPDSASYINYLKNNKDKIIDYLKEVDALA